MKKTKFYVCPQCGNIITAIDEIAISCCGCKLELLEEAKAIDDHAIEIENMDDELYISTLHSMSKEHHISFFAFVTGDKVLIIKQYPEWDVHLRLNKLGHGKLYFYCTQHGLFSKLI